MKEQVMMTVGKSFVKRAGVALIVCSLAFVAVFVYLAKTFGYPDVLHHDAAAVLPALLAGGTRLRAIWFIYALLPLGIIAAGLASPRLLEPAGRRIMTVGRGAGVAAGIAMMIGLFRWPSLQWALARKWEATSAAARGGLAASFDSFNLVLGNVIGEFVGEICLAVWFLALALAFRTGGRRLLGGLGIGAAALLAISAFRNIPSAVDLVAQINNVTLPLWLLTLGIVFVRDGREQPR